MPLSSVQVESGKDSFVHSSFDRVAGAAVRRRGQIHGRWADHVLESVTERGVGRVLQHLPYDLVRVTTLRRGCPYSLHCEVDVHSVESGAS